MGSWKSFWLITTCPTTTCQKEPEEYVEKIIEYLFIKQSHHTSTYQYIFAADETAVYLDYSSSLTIEEKGVKEVPVKTYWPRCAARHYYADHSIWWIQVLARRPA